MQIMSIHVGSEAGATPAMGLGSVGTLLGAGAPMYS